MREDGVGVSRRYSRPVPASVDERCRERLAWAAGVEGTAGPPPAAGPPLLPSVSGGSTASRLPPAAARPQSPYTRPRNTTRRAQPGAGRIIGEDTRAVLDEAVRPEGRVGLGSLLAETGRQAALTDDE